MTNQKKIIPREGIIVPLPDGNGNLPAGGKVLLLNSYWYQRESDGDVTFEDVQEAEEVQAEEAAPVQLNKPKAKSK